MEWLERNRSNLAAMLVVLVTVAAAVLLQIPRRPALQVLSPSASPTPPCIKVHVVGAVKTPGVYQLPADGRVDDAVRAAGGASDAADLEALNLATPLRDGQQLAIPRRAEVAAALPVSLKPTPVKSPGKLNLNDASREELEALPGIGPVTAQKLLEYRQRQGRFVSVEELRDAKLVNASTYERIKEMVEAR